MKDFGPDLLSVVYVDGDPGSGGERIELAPLKGNQGAQNYELPAGVDPASVAAVAVWCKCFDSAFAEARLVIS